MLNPARRAARAMGGESRADHDDSNPLGRERRAVPLRMGREVPCAGRYGHAAVPPHVGDGPPADLRVLVDRLRAIRAAHGETALRADYRRRHRWRPSGRSRIGASGRHSGSSRHAARARRGSAPDGLAILAVYREHPHATEREHRDAVPSGPKTRSGLRVIAAAPHLRHLAALVLLGSTSAALLDYLFKARAVEAIGTGDQLLRFFALYYAAISLLTVTLQIVSSRTVLERFGLALTTSTPSIALLAGSIGGLVTPGFGSLVIARAGESIFRGSWFRAGYELFYTPIPAAEKRAVKSIVDVSVDRLGDAVGGGLVRLGRASRSCHAFVCNSVDGDCELGSRDLRRKPAESLVRANAWHEPGAAGARSRSSRHRRTLTRRMLLKVRSARPLSPAMPADEVDDAQALREGNRERSVAVLSREEGLSVGLVSHVIPLLAGPLSDYAVFALRKVAEERVGQLTDALLDPSVDYKIRRQIARALSVGVSQRAADALVLALDDERFDVRFQSARSVAAILERNPRIRIDRERILDVVLRETAVGRPVWTSRRLLDGGYHRIAARRVRARSIGPEPRPRLYAAVSCSPKSAAPNRLREPPQREQPPSGNRPRVPRRRVTTESAGPALAVSRGEAHDSPSQPHDQIMANLLRSSSSVTLHGVAAGLWAVSSKL